MAIYTFFFFVFLCLSKQAGSQTSSSTPPFSLPAVFVYTGSYQFLAVPYAVTLEVHLWGAGGGKLGSLFAGASQGGAGAYVTGLLNVSAGTTLRIIVGRAGLCSNSGNALDVNGAGGDGYASNCGYVGCGGGGRSALQTWKAETGAWADMACAGGGGGTGDYSSPNNWHAGAASWNSTGRRSIDQAQTTERYPQGSSSWCGGGGNVSGGLCNWGSGGTNGRNFSGGNALRNPFACPPDGAVAYFAGGGGGFFGGGGGGGNWGGGGSSLISNLANASGDEAPPWAPFISTGTASKFWVPGVAASTNNGRVAINAFPVSSSTSPSPSLSPSPSRRPDLVAQYLFDDDSFKDSSGNGAHLSFVNNGNGNATIISGKCGGFGVRIKANAGLVTAAPPFGLPTGARSFTVLAWIRDADYSGSVTYWLGWGNTGSGANGANVAIGVNYVNCLWISGHDVVTWRYGNPGACMSLYINDGLWHHFAYTFDGMGLGVYRDGLLVVNATFASPNFAATPLTLGNTGNAGFYPGYTFGDFDNVRLFSRVLTPSDIATIIALDCPSATQSPSPSSSGSVSPASSRSRSSTLSGSPSRIASQSLSPSTSATSTQSQSPPASASASASASAVSPSPSVSVSVSLSASSSASSQPTPSPTPSRMPSPCVNPLAVPVDIVSLASLCADASDPRSSGDSVPPLCFWGLGAACRPCPPGGLCPGGYTLWSAPGFFVLDAATASDPVPCAFPAVARCPGFNTTVGRTICGEGYAIASFACGQCAPGFFTQGSGACAPCPGGTTVASSLSALAGVAVAAVVVIGAGGAVGGLGVLLAVRAGGAARPALARSAKFVLTAFSALQLAAQMTRSAPAGLSPFVDAVFAGLRGLQFEGLSPIPFACTDLPPLAIPTGILSCALALSAFWAVAASAWFIHAVRRSTDAQAGGTSAKKKASFLSTFAAGCGAAATTRRLAGAGVAAASLALTVVGLLYAIIANAAFGVLVCNAATVTLPQYLLLAQDGSAAEAALGVRAADLYSAHDPVLLAAPFSVSLMAANADVVCGEGAHVAAARLAWAVVMFFLVGIPLATAAFLRAAAMPAVLRATPMPAALWPATPHVSFGGASVDAVLAHTGLTSPAARAASAAGLSPRVTEWELYVKRRGEAAARQERFIILGTPALRPLRRLAAAVCGAGSRFDGYTALRVLPEQRALASARLGARHAGSNVAGWLRRTPAAPAVTGDGDTAAARLQGADAARPPLRFEAPLATFAAAGGAAAEPVAGSARNAVLEADTVGTLCGCSCACTRRYVRGVQTDSDVLDSSLGLRDAAARLQLLSPLLGADFRASQAHFVQLNWALLGAMTAANVAVPATAPPAAVLARGVCVAAACVALLAALLAARPMQPHAEWLLPLRAYILALAAAGSFFVALASAAPDSAAVRPLGAVVATLAVALLPIFSAVFILHERAGVQAERCVASIAAAARAAPVHHVPPATRAAQLLALDALLMADLPNSDGATSFGGAGGNGSGGSSFEAPAAMRLLASRCEGELSSLGLRNSVVFNPMRTRQASPAARPRAPSAAARQT